MLGANDLDASKAFYDAALGALGTAPGRGDDKGRVLYASGGALFMLTRPIDGNDAWHAAGLAHGGTACEDPPGWRETPFGGLYLAYLRDPAGNKVCAAFREPR
jgi:catechol 2,3-dioxygenase-like lactoylglutathione lyase family enzyme